MVRSPLASHFTRDFLISNALDPAKFRAWALAPGMGMAERESWWGSLKPRPLPHEGVDLCCYIPSEGPPRFLPEKARIPAILDGVVTRLLTDFLGISVFVEHGMEGGRLLTIFGHTLPRQGLAVGDRLQAGECFAAVAPRRRSRTGPHPHLHLSLAWSAGTVDYDGLDWPNMRERLQLLDPASILGASCEPFSLEALRCLDLASMEGRRKA